MYRNNVDPGGRKKSRLLRLFGRVVLSWEKAEGLHFPAGRPPRPGMSARIANDVLGKVTPEVRGPELEDSRTGLPGAELSEEERRQAIEEIRRRPRIG